MIVASVSILRRISVLVAILATSVVGFASQAQVIQSNSEADLIFQQALEAFEDGDYGMAARRFQLVVNSYDLHTNTTAAWLMAGNALYRAGDYESAIVWLDDLIQQYPSSSYANEALAISTYARERRAVSDDREEITLGVLLPMDGDARSLTQSMFDGIRLAVEEFNAFSGGSAQQVRLVFRESSSDAIKTTRAVRELADQDVTFFVGPLYSRAALTAAAAAEDERIVMIAPLATDEGVSRGRNYVYQANPTLALRGRLMARMAMTGLRQNRFGVIAEFDNSVSEQMAEGFQDEILKLGGEIDFVDLLPGANSWFRLQDRLIPDSLLNIDAIYMPIAGGNATTLVKGALDSFDRIGVPVRILGNKEFHDLPSYSQPSTYHTLYTTDYLLDDENAALELFNQRHQSLDGREPSSLTYVGYDVTRFVLQQLLGERDPQKALARSGFYQGLGIRINFAGGHVNEAMYYMRYRNADLERVR